MMYQYVANRGYWGRLRLARTVVWIAAVGIGARKTPGAS
jgi:hypothetical protein